MKKILFIVPEFPSISETFIVNQITSLIDLGHDIIIFSLGKPEKIIVHDKIIEYKLLDKVIYPNFENRFSKFFKKIFSRHILTTLKSLNIFKFGKDAFRLTNFCKAYPFFYLKDNFDIVHIHFGQMLENYLLLKEIGFIKNQKTFLTFHGYDLEPKDKLFNRIRYKGLLRNDVHITLNTPYLESVFIETFPELNNYSILPVGLDTNYFKPKRESYMNNVTNIVFCGRFIELKGIKRLPNIIKLVLERNTSKNIHFHIIGDGEDELRNEFLSKLNQFNLLENVTYYKSLPQQEIIKIYNKSDIFILPGIYDNGRAETQGLVIQEAQAMELPVVVTDAGGMKYGVINNKTGYVVDYKSDEVFVDKINVLIGDNNKRKVFGANAREFVVKNYDNHVLAATLLKTYNK